MWKANEFSPLPQESPLIAYGLENNYTTRDLNRGSEGLKGDDAVILNRVLPVAQSLGFVVCVGNLTKTEKGTAEERCGGWGSDGGYDEYDEDPPVMVDIDEESFKITHLVHLNRGSNAAFKELRIEEDCIIPEGLFADVIPDGQSRARSSIVSVLLPPVNISSALLI